MNNSVAEYREHAEYALEKAGERTQRIAQIAARQIDALGTAAVTNVYPTVHLELANLSKYIQDLQNRNLENEDAVKKLGLEEEEVRMKIHALEGKIKKAEDLSAPKSDTFEFDSKEEEKELIFSDAEQKKFYKHIGGKPAKPGKEKIDPLKDIVKTMVIIFEGKVNYHDSKEKELFGDSAILNFQIQNVDVSDFPDDVTEEIKKGYQEIKDGMAKAPSKAGDTDLMKKACVFIEEIIGKLEAAKKKKIYIDQKLEALKQGSNLSVMKKELKELEMSRELIHRQVNFLKLLNHQAEIDAAIEYKQALKEGYNELTNIAREVEEQHLQNVPILEGPPQSH